MPFELRRPTESDVDVFFEHQLDTKARWMAAFTPKDPTDRAAYDKKWRKILDRDSFHKRTVVVAGQVAGHVVVYDSDDGHEVTYWLGRAFWGHGLATRALAAVLAEVQIRPLRARTAYDNVASARVLVNNGFVLSHEQTFFAETRKKDIVERVFTLS
ncbi:GNAT family N-acetyltransferase [Parafrankia sp. FMc6]|uniref:GNAT family N-acetyltransferase n=1 Tax=Parafrankia soli TaxID=2599596 RepID=UPI0034D661BC